MRSVTAMAAIALGVAAGCSRPAPEERLVAVGEDISNTQNRLESLRAENARHEDAIQRLRKEQRRAEARLLTLEERLQRRATDVAIFRAAQSALLDEPTLQSAAVVANVEDGVVTLNGSVSNLREQQTALDIVRAIPGVSSTVVRLQLIDESEGDAK